MFHKPDTFILNLTHRHHQIAQKDRNSYASINRHTYEGVVLLLIHVGQRRMEQVRRIPRVNHSVRASPQEPTIRGFPEVSFAASHYLVDSE